MSMQFEELKSAIDKHSVAYKAYRESFNDRDAINAWDEATREFYAVINNKEIEIVTSLLAALEEKDQELSKAKDHLQDVERVRDAFAAEACHLGAIAKKLPSAERRVGELLLRAEAAEKRLQQPIRQQHAEWSNAMFGSVGPIGPLRHLAKEALEAAAKPEDLLEWADMQFLLWDAQRRAGITDEQMIEAMETKLPILKARKWPKPKDGEPCFHIKIEGE